MTKKQHEFQENLDKLNIQPVKLDSQIVEKSWYTENQNPAVKFQLIEADGTYWTCAPTEWNRILATLDTRNDQYVRDRYDCNHFALRAKAEVDYRYGLNAFGLVIDWSGRHSYNIALCAYQSEGKQVLEWRVVEPEADEWVADARLHQPPYSLISGQVFL